MKYFLIIILFFAGADCISAQGIITDEKTGMTLEYPEEWLKVDSFDKLTFILSTDAALIIKTKYTDTVMTADEMLSDLETNLGRYTNVLSSIYKDDFAISSFGKTMVGNLDAVYLNTFMNLRDNEEPKKVKMLVLDHKNYSYLFLIICNEINDYCTTEAEILLLSVMFP